MIAHKLKDTYCKPLYLLRELLTELNGDTVKTSNYKGSNYMGRRFYHQQRAEQYKAEKIVIDAWMDKTQAQKATLYEAQVQKTGNKKSNVGTQPGYIIPFGYAQSKKVYLKVGLVKEGTNLATTEENEAGMITALRTVVIGATLYAQTAAPATGSFITDVSRKKIVVPRIKIVKVGNTLAEKLASRITGRKYTYTKKDAVSCPFGQKIGGTDDEITFEGVTATFVGLSTATGGALAAYSVYTTPQGKLPISVT